MTPLYEAMMYKKRRKERTKEFIENAILQLIGAVVIGGFGWLVLHLCNVAIEWVDKL